MVVPGLYSILSTIRLDFGACDEAPGWLEISRRLVGPALSHGDHRGFRARPLGQRRGFHALSPVPAPTLEQAEARLSGREFADRRATVVGGSRRLGACAAKLIAAGGGSVADLSQRPVGGRGDSRRDRRSLCPDRCAIVRYDAADPARQLDTVPGSFTHVYYFATGPIADPSDGRFDRVRFDGFVDIYVAGFEQLARTPVERQPETPLHMLYPSSAFVEMRPRSMTEYAMARPRADPLRRSRAPSPEPHHQHAPIAAGSDRPDRHRAAGSVRRSGRRAAADPAGRGAGRLSGWRSPTNEAWQGAESAKSRYDVGSGRTKGPRC